MHEVNIRWKRPLDGRDIVTEQTDYFDDRIADAILHGSPYERLRVRRNSLFDQRIPTKLAWQSAILLVLSLVAPITLGYSGAVAALFPGATPLASSPVILMPGVLALVIETGAATGHLAVAATLLSGESDLSTRRMRQLLSVEEMASFYGLIGGALLLAITVTFFLLGYAGVETIQQYTATGAQGPFDASGTGLSVLAVSAVSFVGSVMLFAGSRLLDSRMR
ncbi:hypothetical protein [Haladaptatus sp. DYF46]|uniref:hypothetical protein n=1 Tax=unclassified Haladaptatus TaxID=2622732 RepID=UPI001E63E38C|nr:hypothetical protein [Haladaptatus sp. DYF46]